jgi:hypothetical protein
MAEISYVLKKNYLSVLVEGKPFAMDSTHPSFSEMKTAILDKKWELVPRLVTSAEKISRETNGEVTVENDTVLYKGSPVDTSLTQRIIAIIREGKDATSMLKFMDNLYKNPSKAAQKELYDWLRGCNLPITDDGCFVAYKAIKDNYTDMHTGKISNKIGKVVFMKRKAVDDNRHNHCSTGLHFASVSYIPNMHGERVMKVKINPKDVVSIPSDYSYTKGRTWRYEVIGEVEKGQIALYIEQGKDIEEFTSSVVEVAKDRQTLLKLLFADQKIKNYIKRGKIKRTTIEKQTFGRLQQMAKRFKVTLEKSPIASQIAPERSKVLENPMKGAREAAKLSIGQVAEVLGIGYKGAWALENSQNPRQDSIDQYLEAIAKLTNKDVDDDAVFSYDSVSADAVNVDAVNA